MDFYILSRQSCREECVALNVMKQCMCKLVWWNSTFDHLMAQEKFKICTIEEHVKCLNNIHDHQVKCNCPVACEDIRKSRKNKLEKKRLLYRTIFKSRLMQKKPFKFFGTLYFPCKAIKSTLFTMGFMNITLIS